MATSEIIGSKEARDKGICQFCGGQCLDGEVTLQHGCKSVYAHTECHELQTGSKGIRTFLKKGKPLREFDQVTG
jgi:hypothetical protein